MDNKNNQNKSIPMSGMPLGRPGGGHGGGRPNMAEKVRAKDTKMTVSRILKYLGNQRVTLIIVLFLVVLSTGLALLGPYLISVAIDDYIGQGIYKGLINVVIAMVVAYVSSALITWFQTYMMAGLAQIAIRDMRKDFFEKLQTFSLKFFDQKSNGELMSRLTNDIENVNRTLSQSITQLFSSALSLVGVLIVMLAINWKLALVTMISIPMTVFTAGFIAKVTRTNYRLQQKNLGELNGLIEETLSGQKVVKVYGKEESVIQDFKKVNKALKEASLRAEMYGGVMGPSMNLINNLSFAILISAGGLLAVRGSVSIGTIAAFISYSKYLGRPVMQIANVYNTIQSAIAGAERVFETMDELPELVDRENATTLDNVKGNVEFKDVNFGYNKDVKVLKEANFVAKQGEMIALVGPTGAGKTTIINLLTRFYDIDSGSITIDGVDIRDVKKHSLRSQLGIVLQDTYLFSESVRENIRYGRLDATDKEVEEAAKLAYADHFIKCLPHGYDTKLSQEGSNLSQGQRQLIAIARAILSDPKILILDEATSSVDTRTEVHIQKAMLNLMEGRTSFVIAHRLSTIKDADTIMVINAGEIVERGSHQSLIENKGFYYNLYNSQFRGEAS